MDLGNGFTFLKQPNPLCQNLKHDFHAHFWIQEVKTVYAYRNSSTWRHMKEQLFVYLMHTFEILFRGKLHGRTGQFHSFTKGTILSVYTKIMPFEYAETCRKIGKNYSNRLFYHQTLINKFILRLQTKLVCQYNIFS